MEGKADGIFLPGKLRPPEPPPVVIRAGVKVEVSSGIPPEGIMNPVQRKARSADPVCVPADNLPHMPRIFGKMLRSSDSEEDVAKSSLPVPNSHAVPDRAIVQKGRFRPPLVSKKIAEDLPSIRKSPKGIPFYRHFSVPFSFSFSPWLFCFPRSLTPSRMPFAPASRISSSPSSMPLSMTAFPPAS